MCGVGGGGGKRAHTPLFCQIIIKSALNRLESKTKIFAVANDPRHPQNLDLLLHLSTKIQPIFKQICNREFYSIFQKKN